MMVKVVKLRSCFSYRPVLHSVMGSFSASVLRTRSSNYSSFRYFIASIGWRGPNLSIYFWTFVGRGFLALNVTCINALFWFFSEARQKARLEANADMY